MPARKRLSDYEAICGPVTQIDREEFDNTNMQDMIKVVCKCGEEYISKRALLAARMNRGNQPKCLRCVNQRNAMRLGEQSE